MRVPLYSCISRRRLIERSAATFTSVGLSFQALRSAAAQGLTVSKLRRDWHFCYKCAVMFYADGTPNVCAADGKQHVARGNNFTLPFDVPDGATAQSKWYSCKYCRALIFGGYPQSGRCPATRGGHQFDKTFHYVLPHDIAVTAKSQNRWRYCGKCFSMFYDGDAAKGICAADKQGHVAQGYDFVLPFDR